MPEVLAQVIDSFEEVRTLFPTNDSDSALGVYSNDDWERIRQAYEVIDGRNVLDVGVGNGAMLHLLSKSARFSNITGVDIKPHSMLDIPEDVTFLQMSVTDMQFPDAGFDTVVCMEVLEHLEVADFPRALSELRRVAKNRLIVTVPLNEPEPVWWHDKPGGHRQSFSLDRLRSIFPNALAVEISRGNSTPWIMIVEDRRYQQASLCIFQHEEVSQFLEGWWSP